MPDSALHRALAPGAGNRRRSVRTASPAAATPRCGSFQGSSFPGNDYSYVATNDDWSTSPLMNGYGNGDATITGSSVVGVGQSVCRSGSTSGWHCGTIEATNQTVNYAEGTVFGLTETNACAEPGDSGGSGDCTSGGTTFFQPVNEILSAFGLSLLTG